MYVYLWGFRFRGTDEGGEEYLLQLGGRTVSKEGRTTNDVNDLFSTPHISNFFFTSNVLLEWPSSLMFLPYTSYLVDIEF